MDWHPPQEKHKALVKVNIHEKAMADLWCLLDHTLMRETNRKTKVASLTHSSMDRKMLTISLNGGRS